MLHYLDLSGVLYKEPADETVGLYQTELQDQGLADVLDWKLLAAAQPAILKKEKVNAAFEILNQAKELYPNEAEILYRLVGLFYNIEEETNAIETLKTALTIDFNKNYILKEAFPHVWECETVQNSIKKHTL